MDAYSLVFLSSGEISIPLLKALHEDERFNIVKLVCAPDKVSGRGNKLKVPQTKIVAEKLGIPVLQTDKLMEGDIEADIFLTFAYGNIIDMSVLNKAKYPLNVHASLLPKYRGASPFQAALLNGDSECGLSLMRMEEKMDAGPVYAMQSLSILPHMTAGLLHDELADFAAEFIPDELANLGEPKDQDHSQASYCKKIIREDGFVDFTKSAEEISRIFHAYTPWPGLWTKYDGKRIKLIDIGVVDRSLEPGKVSCSDGKVLLGTSNGCLELLQVQLEGKQCLHADQFIIGQKEFCSSHLPS